MKIQYLIFCFLIFASTSYAQPQNDYYTLEESRKGDAVTVVFHIVVIDSNNSAGINYRQATKEFLLFRDDSLGFISTLVKSKIPFLLADSVKTKIQNGEIVERIEVVTFSALSTSGQKRTAIRDRFNELRTIVRDRIISELELWGGGEIVP